MRAERRREIERQMAQQKETKKGNGLFGALAVIYLLTGGVFLYFLFKLNMLPAGYLYPGIAILAVVTLFNIPAMISKKGKRNRKILASVIAVILIAVFCVGSYYLASTGGFLKSLTARNVPTEDFLVLARSEDMPEGWDSKGDSEKEEIAKERLDSQYVCTFNSNNNIYASAKALLQQKMDVEYDFTDTAGSCLDYLLNYTYDYVFLPAAEYTALTGDEYYSYKDSMFTLYTVKVPRETSDRTKKVNVTKEPFNILISGTDQEGYRSDVNMIATVNPVKHEVLLTSLPRDLYVTLPSFGEKDKLTHSRIYGLEETQAAIEQELGIDINYYVSVNFYALENIVDAIGGIDVESPCAFQTIGRDGYDIYYDEGINHLDGREALAFCRERDSFESGDMTRNENQQAVLKAILEKGMSSSTILSSYTDVLAAATGSMFTTMSEDEMADLVKMQLKDMPGWEIKRHAIKGTPDMDYCYSLGQYASIVYPIEDEITMAVDEIAKTKLMD